MICRETCAAQKYQSQSYSFTKVIFVSSTFSTDALQLQMPHQGNCHFHYPETVWKCRLDLRRHVFFSFFWRSSYRKVLLFISKAPQFRSRKTQWLNKSFNEAVQLSFYCRSRPQQRLVLWLTDTRKQMQVADFSHFCFPAKWGLLITSSSFCKRKFCRECFRLLRIISSSQGLHEYLFLEILSNLPLGLKQALRWAACSLIQPRQSKLRL